MKQPQLGHTVAILRRTKGLTQEDLANACGINVRSLQRIESGEVMPRMYTLKQLSTQLNHDLVSQVSETLIIDQPQHWWTFGVEESLGQVFKLGWIAGIIYFLLSIPEAAAVFLRLTDDLDFTGKLFYSGVNIAVIISAVFFYRGFAALGTKVEQSLLTVCSWLMIVVTLVVYSFDLVSIWWGLEMEFVAVVELMLFGFTGIFFGIGLSRTESELGNVAKIGGILEVLIGVSSVLVVTFFIALILILPAIILEIIILYRAYQLYAETDGPFPFITSRS